MKTPRFLLALAASASLLAAGGSANAAGLFYSFDTAKDGNGLATTAVTAREGFLSATPVTLAGTSLRTQMDGGESSFTSFQGGTPWLGSGGSAVPGHSLGWNAGSSGNSFLFTLNTTGTEDLMIRLAVRSFAGSSGSPLTGFSSVTYDTGSGPVAITSGISNFTAGSAFSVWSADLSSLTAVENQAAVTFQWNFATTTSNNSFRVDNIQVTAVPEPSTLGLMGLALGALALRRRRAARQ